MVGYCGNVLFDNLVVRSERVATSLECEEKGSRAMFVLQGRE